MDPLIERIYLRELLVECENAVGAVRQMNRLLAESSTAEFFREAADFLQHTAAASRLLWPPAGPSDAARRARANARGAYLGACSI